MIKINIIKFGIMRSDAHFQFLSAFKDLVVAKGMVNVFHAELWTSFEDLLQKENDLIHLPRVATLVKLLEMSDDRKNKALTGINNFLAAGLNHFDPEVAEASASVFNRLKEFIPVNSRSCAEEIEANSSLLAEIDSDCASQIVLLNLKPWLDELAATTSEFQRNFMLRHLRRSTNPDGKLTVIKKRINDVYRQLIFNLESMLLVRSTPELVTFARLWNLHIDHFNSRARRASKRKIAIAIFDAIPDQKLVEGRPATPIPVVRYKGKLLSCTTDYDVSYQNNDKVGTASVVVKGKKTYTGRRAISFNIVRGND